MHFPPLQHTICTLSIKVGPDCFSPCAFANTELSQLNALFLQLLNIEQQYVEPFILHKPSCHPGEKCEQHCILDSTSIHVSFFCF